MPAFAVAADDRVAGCDLRAPTARVVVVHERRAEIGMRLPKRAGKIAVRQSTRLSLQDMHEFVRCGGRIGNGSPRGNRDAARTLRLSQRPRRDVHRAKPGRVAAGKGTGKRTAARVDEPQAGVQHVDIDLVRDAVASLGGRHARLLDDNVPRHFQAVEILLDVRADRLHVRREPAAPFDDEVLAGELSGKAEAADRGCAARVADQPFLFGNGRRRGIANFDDVGRGQRFVVYAGLVDVPGETAMIVARGSVVARHARTAGAEQEARRAVRAADADRLRQADRRGVAGTELLAVEVTLEAIGLNRLRWIERHDHMMPAAGDDFVGAENRNVPLLQPRTPLFQAPT